MRRSSPPCAAAIPTRPRARCTRTSIRSPICCRPTTAMDPADIDAYLVRLDEAIGRGRRLRDTLRRAPDDPAAFAGARIWQHDCEAAVADLSGGSKSHLLARRYRPALLVLPNSAPPGRAVLRDLVAPH